MALAHAGCRTAAAGFHATFCRTRHGSAATRRRANGGQCGGGRHGGRHQAGKRGAGRTCHHLGRPAAHSTLSAPAHAAYRSNLTHIEPSSGHGPTLLSATVARLGALLTMAGFMLGTLVTACLANSGA